MATNPKLPQPPRHEHGRPVLVEKKAFPWPIIAIIVAALLLVVIFVLAPSMPKKQAPPVAGEVPPQPTGAQLQLSGVRVVSGAVGSQLALDGLVTNTGNTDVNGVLVQATFKDASGANAETLSVPMMGKTQDGQTEPLTKAPIKSNEARPFRLVFDHVPQNWNHQVPALSIAAVTAVGSGKSGSTSPSSPSK